MARVPDIGDLTFEQTKELAETCLGVMPLSDRIQAVLAAFNDEERQELMAWLDEHAGDNEP
jgi:hypothetical protein